MSSPDSPQLSGYVLAHFIGRGNTSKVYLGAPSKELGRSLAIKLPLATTLADRVAAERFGNEVRLSLQFKHPHLVRGYAGTPHGEGAYLAMDYFQGGTLADQLMQQGGRLPYPQAMRLLADVSAGVAYLHQQGAVHQDIKTQNVYLSGGRAALGDFGSTYFISAGGNISGSPFYMAPEIYHGEGSSVQSDVYSFGVLCFELLTGRRPHLGSSYEELMVSHLTHFPAPVTAGCAEVPRALSRLIELAMAKKPQDRPSSLELRRALYTTLGETDEALAPEAQPPAAPERVLMGRHQHLPTKPPPLPTDAPGETSTPVSAPNAKTVAKPAPRRWNPFKRK